MVKHDGNGTSSTGSRRSTTSCRGCRKPISACSPRRIPPWKSCSFAQGWGRGFPPAPQRLFRRRQARRHPVARNADRGARDARPRARHRLVPAQGPSADRAPPASGGEARCADPHAALGGRRLADADREQEDRFPAEIPGGVASFKDILAGGKNAAVFLGNSPSSTRRPRRSMLQRRRSASGWVFAKPPTRSAATSPACRRTATSTRS